MQKSGYYLIFFTLFLAFFVNITFANEFMDQVNQIAIILNIVSIFVIVVSSLFIIFGIIKYFYAKDDKDKKRKTKNMFFSALIILFLSFWLYAALNFSTP